MQNRKMFQGYVNVYRSSSLANYLSGDFYFNENNDTPSYTMFRLPKKLVQHFNQGRGTANKFFKVSFIASTRGSSFFNVRGIKILKHG